jgi:hypothetical protein
MSWLFLPLMWATKPTPQASRSWRGSYKPCCFGKLTTVYLNQIKLGVKNCYAGQKTEETYHRCTDLCACIAYALLKQKKTTRVAIPTNYAHTKAKGLEYYL